MQHPRRSHDDQEIEPRALSRRMRPSRGLGAPRDPFARAQTDGRSCVGTWGGDYANLLTKHVAKPVLGRKGSRSSGHRRRQACSARPRPWPRSACPAARRRAGLTATDIVELNEIDVLEKLDYSRL